MKRPQTKSHADTMSDSKVMMPKKVKIYHEVKIYRYVKRFLQHIFFSLSLFCWSYNNRYRYAFASL